MVVGRPVAAVEAIAIKVPTAAAALEIAEAVTVVVAVTPMMALGTAAVVAVMVAEAGA